MPADSASGDGAETKSTVPASASGLPPSKATVDALAKESPLVLLMHLEAGDEAERLAALQALWRQSAFSE
jgi:hypothetical protein